jgi:fructose-bisphosphate aldolase class II
VNGRDVYKTLAGHKTIVMACNIRIPLVIPGIMRAARELDAIVAFELAKSEGDLKGGYTGMTPAIFVDTILAAAKKENFSLPFIIHGDHITVKNKTEAEIEGSRALIAAELAAGYTSFAIDASFNEIPDNARITADLSRPIADRGLGLEVEVGEIKSAGTEAHLSTVEEAVELMERLAAAGVSADLLAINNGSKHGNYLVGEKISIDLDRTGRIYEAIHGRFGASIAQHGITGTPLHLVGKFAEYGIRKGNVGTQWQNIAHAGLPPELMAKMKEWAKGRQGFEIIRNSSRRNDSAPPHGEKRKRRTTRRSGSSRRSGPPARRRSSPERSPGSLSTEGARRRGEVGGGERFAPRAAPPSGRPPTGSARPCSRSSGTT